MRVLLIALTSALVSFATPAPAAQAAECAGPLRANLIRIQVAYTLAPPPTGYQYATQPNVDPAAGDRVPVSVMAARDEGCAVASASVVLQAREVGKTEFRTVRTGTTNQQGYAIFEVRPVRLTELRASVTVGDETAAANPVNVNIRRALSASYFGGPGCELVAAGRVYPRSAGAPVWLQRRITRDGKELGFVTLAKGTSGSDGVYRLRYKAPCGARYALAAYAPASQGNTSGRALYVDLDVLARP